MLAFSLYSALPQSTNFSRDSNERDFLVVFGLIFAIFICASIAITSTFTGDRIVFGAIAIAFVLRVFIRLLQPAPEALSVMNATLCHWFTRLPQQAPWSSCYRKQIKVEQCPQLPVVDTGRVNTQPLETPAGLPPFLFIHYPGLPVRCNE